MLRCNVILLICLFILLWLEMTDYQKDKIKSDLSPLKRKVELIRLERKKSALLKEIEEAEKEDINVRERYNTYKDKKNS